MSEPGAMRSRGSASLALRVLLAVGFVIAAGATVLVILAKDVQLLRLAAVLALWAALIAAFAVTRSRRDAKAAAMREKEAYLAYQVELHREVSARHEYEAELAAQMAEAQSQQIAELREQLDRLTEVLTALADGEVFVSRMTLSAESARFRAGQSLAAGPAPAAVTGEPARAIGWVEPGGQTVHAVSGAVAEPAAPVSVAVPSVPVAEDEAHEQEPAQESMRGPAREPVRRPAERGAAASVETPGVRAAPRARQAESAEQPVSERSAPEQPAPGRAAPAASPRSVFDAFLPDGSAQPKPESVPPAGARGSHGAADAPDGAEGEESLTASAAPDAEPEHSARVTARVSAEPAAPVATTHQADRMPAEPSVTAPAEPEPARAVPAESEVARVAAEPTAPVPARPEAVREPAGHAAPGPAESGRAASVSAEPGSPAAARAATASAELEQAEAVPAATRREPAAATPAAAESAPPAEPAATAPAEPEPAPTGRRSRHAVDDDEAEGAEVPWWRRAVDEAVSARNSEPAPSSETQPRPLPTPEPAPEPFAPEPLPEPLPVPTPAPQPGPVRPPSPDPVYPPSPDPVPLYQPAPGSTSSSPAFAPAASSSPFATGFISTAQPQGPAQSQGRAQQHDQHAAPANGAPQPPAHSQQAAQPHQAAPATGTSSYTPPSLDETADLSPEELLAAYGLTAAARRRRRD